MEEVKPGNTSADVQGKLGDPGDYSETGLSFMHGIGLDIHEWAYASAFSPKDPLTLKQNMVFAIEIHAHHETHGERLEHNILVTDHGYEILSIYPLGEDSE